MAPGCGNRCRMESGPPTSVLIKRSGVRGKGSEKSKTYYIHSFFHVWMKNEDLKMLISSWNDI